MQEESVRQEVGGGNRPLSHDLPCVTCGHPAHPYLPCGGGCDCRPTPLPGERGPG